MHCIASEQEQQVLDHFDRDPARCRFTTKLRGKGLFVLFVNRCGSNYLVDMLNQQPSYALEHEVFNADPIINNCKLHGFNGFEHYVHFLRDRHAAPCWGAKIGAGQLGMLYRFGLLGAFENGSRIIWLKRKNIIAQAVSHFVALGTHQWASFQSEEAPMPAYDYDAIAEIVQQTILGNARAETILGLTGLKFTSLWYEEFLHAPNLQMRRIANFTGEPFQKLNLATTQFERQEHPVKADYIERFTVDARRKMALTDDAYSADSPIWAALAQ